MSATPAAPYSIDGNMMHISYESGILEDPMTPPPLEMFSLTGNPVLAPNEPEPMTIVFKGGIPVRVINSLDREDVTGSVEILDYLNRVGGKHSIGRIDIIEDRFIGMKSRGVYETPAGTILYEAIRDLELLCLDRVSPLFHSEFFQIFPVTS